MAEQEPPPERPKIPEGHNHSRSFHLRSLLRSLVQVWPCDIANGENGLELVPKNSTDAPYQVTGFLEILSAEGQHELEVWVYELRLEIWTKKKQHRESRLIGGPFDGEKIDPRLSGGTVCRKVRSAWWAVYKRTIGEYQAHFVGFATSETKGKTYQLSHATPAAKIKPIPKQGQADGAH